MRGIGQSMQADIRNVYTIFNIEKLDSRNQGNENMGSINGQKFWKKLIDCKTVSR
jgi:hypothetical protein